MSGDLLRDAVSPVLAPRVAAGEFLTPPEVAGQIENFEVSPEQTLRSIRGPAPYLHKVSSVFYSHDYIHGVHHCRLGDGQRDVLLVHDGDKLLEFDGSSQTWATIIASTGGVFDSTLPDRRGPHPPTRFITTPQGVIILPYGGDQRPFFYDGVFAGHLGYRRPPGPPIGAGPSSVASDDGTNPSAANDKGYAIDYSRMNTTRLVTAAKRLWPRAHFGRGRIGTVLTDLAASDDEPRTRLLRGRWTCRAQFIDRWGNLSPLSAESSPIEVDQQSAGLLDNYLPKQFSWSSIITGPPNTIGRQLYRSKDLVNSGTGHFFLSAGYGGSGLSAYATIPDNLSERFQDNVPDGMLGPLPVQDVLPVPRTVAVAVAFGRCWYAAEDGGIYYSDVQRLGTISEGNVVYPDARGGVVRALVAVTGGLLAITDSATYMVTPNENSGFASYTVNPAVGTSAPGSVAAVPGGTIWFDGRRFVMFDHQAGLIIRLPNQQRKRLAQIDRSRTQAACAIADPTTGEYWCWLTEAGNAQNGLCFIYDGAGWRTRTSEQARAACVMEGGERYTLVAGEQTDSGATTLEYVWVLGRTAPDWTPADVVHRFRTGWLHSGTAERSSPTHLELWLRETSETATATVRVYRDWDETKSVTEHTVDLCRRLSDSAPARAWGTATLDGGAELKEGRPLWSRVAIAAPSAESYMVEVETTSGLIELYGLRVSSASRPENRRTQRGSA